MTERKPANMSFASWVDAQIAEAQERGEFDNLAGHGKPIRGIDESYDELWWVRGLLAREGVSWLPPALALRLEVEKLIDALGDLSSEPAVRAKVEDLNTRIREVNRKPRLDLPPSTLMPLNPESVVERWRAARLALALTSAPPPELTVEAEAEGQPKSSRRRWWRRRVGGPLEGGAG